MKKLRERIDLFNSLKPMSHNIPGHEERMREHCERVQREYLSRHGKDGRFTKLYRDKRSRD